MRAACAAVGEPRPATTAGTARAQLLLGQARLSTPQPRALSEVERKQVLAVSTRSEHVDEAPATIYAKLLDEGSYLAGVLPCTGSSLARRGA